MRSFRVILLAIPALVTANAGLACPVCLGPEAPAPSIVQAIVNAGTVALAEPAAEPRKYRLLVPVKGEINVGDTVGVFAADMPRQPLAPDRKVILARHPLYNKWLPIGQIAADRVDWLHQAARLGRDRERSLEDWLAHLKPLLPELLDTEPVIAAAAADRLARAPYTAIRQVAKGIDADGLIALAERIENTAWVPLYALLLGAADTGRARTYVAGSLARVLAYPETNGLAAWLVAHLEIEGESGLMWVRDTILTDTGRHPRQVSAAMMALSQQGLADARIPRRRIVETYLALLAARPELAGYIARDAAEWKVWSLTEAVVRAARSGMLDEANMLMVRSYLKAAPTPDAKDHLTTSPP